MGELQSGQKSNSIRLIGIYDMERSAKKVGNLHGIFVHVESSSNSFRMHNIPPILMISKSIFLSLSLFGNSVSF